MEDAIINIAKLRENKVLKEGERVSIVFQGKEITNFEYMRTSKKLVTALKDLNVKRGDRVIIQMPNCIEVMQSFGAVWRLGAVIVPINHLMGEDEIAYIYQDSGAKVVISSKEFLPKIRAAQAQAPEMETIILTGDDVPGGCLSDHQIVDSSREEHDIVETKDDENAALIYTAGTTGKSKGVIHTHHSLYSNARMQYETQLFPEGMTNICVLPLCHSYGIAVINNGMFRMRTKTILPNSFDLESIFSSIEKYQVNLMAGVPTMYVYMLLYPEPKKYDLSSMKYWLSGSAPLSLETWKKFREVFGGEIIERWGLTEAGVNNASNPIDGLKKVGSIGLPMKGTEMRIMAEDGKLLPPGKQGEIVLRGPSVMKGYWNKPKETEEILVDGWLHTGDVGYVDDDGYFWITDRKKDLIIKGGENISPRRIEEPLYAHPKVSEAAVIGMKDDIYGENIKAFLVLKPGETATAEEIIDYCKTKLKNFLLPKEVVFLKSFPKNLVGKILKKELRKLQ